ncbi:isoleucine--tRNA ligase [Euzebya tangerina]|uniref:isoleucine--tRNA ligase n=1 Tax=Euzebya tangerina TaxID=591198 RepID=UPI000E3233A3|nr:isoleucine--tRNA ligase [Euzebya tangerina]
MSAHDGSDTPTAYPRHGGTVASSPVFPEIEQRILSYWESDGTFEASVEARVAGEGGANEYVFYDGPPFANGLPHYGHLLTGYVKDVVPRFRTMLGNRVERRFGWDCHGLPAEVEAEKQLGITHKSEIEEMGIDVFNDACRTSVLRYTDEWEDYVTRQARWVDFEGDYKTLDLDYMESVMWAFKALHDKGLIYEGFRVLAYCWRCETPLSNTETRMDDVYRQRQDPAVTVGLRLEDSGADDPLDGALAMVWTTTPWTLPSNLAAAVHPELTYQVLRPSEGAFAGRKLVLAEAAVARYVRELGEAPEVVATVVGADLLGRSYTPPFPYFAGRENAHQVLEADYVSAEDGTGLVHIAPAFGEEDKVVTDAAGITPVVPVDSKGEFTAEVSDFAGMHVFEANTPIMRMLREDGVLLRHETYDHPYPHCWRCDNALIYRAVSSWFVEVSRFRDRMVELNEQITWVPEHVKAGSFGQWLEGARDWSISRNRFWGSPIPVWQSDDPTYPRTDVYGSLDELEADFGVRPEDLHRPTIDHLTRPNPDDPTGNSTMRRVPEVLDCWFESGSMPFAQVHYPFENAEWFESHNPGDFIVEYIGQTRGWFYTLHVLATALFDRPAFTTCISHGILLGDDGRKMSKSLQNYPDVREVFDRDGADAMRWFLMSSPVLRGGNLIVTEQGIRDAVRQVMLPLWNTWYFLQLYAGAAGTSGRVRTDSSDLLDRYVLARVRTTVTAMTEALEAGDIAGATAVFADTLDSITNWYVRRSRDRFWNAETEDGQAAVDTLHTVLEVMCRLAAPLLPLVTEEIWRGLTGDRSVHLTDYPTAAELPEDDELVTAMDNVRAVASTTLGIREAERLRVRLPLSTLTIAVTDPDALKPFVALLADEVNVRDVELMTVEAAEAAGVGVSQQLTVNARAAGPRLGREVQGVIQASKTGNWSVEPDCVICGGVRLEEGEYDLSTVVEGSDDHHVVAQLPASVGGFVLLDTQVTPELEAEGWARDLVRAIAEKRREADLHVSDRITLTLSVPVEREGALATHLDMIAAETLATDVAITAEDRPDDSVGITVQRT